MLRLYRDILTATVPHGGLRSACLRSMSAFKCTDTEDGSEGSLETNARFLKIKTKFKLSLFGACVCVNGM